MILQKIKFLIFTIPGVRQRIYRKRFKIDKLTRLNNCYLNGPKGDHIIAENAIVGEKGIVGATPVRVHIKHFGVLHLKKKSFIRGGCKFFINGKGKVTIGENSYINWNSTIATGGSGQIQIGKNCAIAWNVNIIAYDFHVFDEQSYSEDIIIEDNVWIGANVTILKGVRIKQGSVIAANSLVTKGNFPENVLIGGSPGKVIKENISWRNLTKDEKMSLTSMKTDVDIDSI